jgi:hypothetical protein
LREPGGHAAEAVRSILLAKEQMDYVRFQVFDQRPVDDSQPCDLRNGRKSNPGTKIDSVSMSWWLSGAVQEYLDRQLCQSENANEYTRLQSLLYNHTENHVVQAFPANEPNQPFGKTVLPRRPPRNWLVPNAHCPHPLNAGCSSF